MAEPVPAIYVFSRGQDVDARHEAGHDEFYQLAVAFMVGAP
jgi:hypothetical protein